LLVVLVFHVSFMGLLPGDDELSAGRVRKPVNQSSGLLHSRTSFQRAV